MFFKRNAHACRAATLRRYRWVLPQRHPNLYSARHARTLHDKMEELMFVVVCCILLFTVVLLDFISFKMKWKMSLETVANSLNVISLFVKYLPSKLQ
jgi:hypothetical protein